MEHQHITPEEGRATLIAGLAEVLEAVTAPLLEEADRLRRLNAKLAAKLVEMNVDPEWIGTED